MFLIKYDDGNCSGKGITGFFLNLQKSIHKRSCFPFSLRERLGKWLESQFCIHLHQCIPNGNTFQGTQAQRWISGNSNRRDCLWPWILASESLVRIPAFTVNGFAALGDMT